MGQTKEIEELLKDDNKVKEKFVTELENVLKKLGKKKKDLAKAMGINTQTLYNWFGKEGAPDWVVQMFKMFCFLSEDLHCYNPLRLFDDKFADSLDRSIEYMLYALNGGFDKFFNDYEKHFDLLYRNRSIHLDRIFRTPNLFIIMMYIKFNYIDLPREKRNKGVGKKSVSYMKDILFEFFIDVMDFREQQNKYNYLIKENPKEWEPYLKKNKNKSLQN